jgi:hypothetical protein
MLRKAALPARIDPLSFAKIGMGRWPTLQHEIGYHARAPTPGHVDDVW